MKKANDAEAELLLRLESHIEVADTNYFVNRPECFVFRYSYMGKFKTVVVEKGLPAAQLLQKYQKIDGFPAVRNDGSVGMYTKSIITSKGPKGQPVLQAWRAPFKWEDAYFTHREAIEICTLSEFKEASQQSGNLAAKMIGKVIDFGSAFINQAA